MWVTRFSARWCALALVSAAALGACSCDSAYYRTMEMFGKQKRDILVDRVGDAREGQQAAKQEFQTALEKFSAVTKFKGGDLEAKYEDLKAELVAQRVAGRGRPSTDRQS